MNIKIETNIKEDVSKYSLNLVSICKQFNFALDKIKWWIIACDRFQIYIVYECFKIVPICT